MVFKASKKDTVTLDALKTTPFCKSFKTFSCKKPALESPYFKLLGL